MGTDIHMYVQYREKERANSQYDFWYSFGERINPGRCYDMFAILSDGVRGRWKKHFRAKGLPTKMGYSAENDAYLWIREKDEDPRDYENRSCTLEDALRWGREIIRDKEGKPFKTAHPDWHSHSWLNVSEFEQALKWYKEQTKYTPSVEYRALFKAMKELENRGKNEVIVVFWFDN